MSEVAMSAGFGLKAAAPIKVKTNIGAGFDIPTGTYIKGLNGEHILNGGVAYLTGMTGIGNSFKSTIFHYMLITILARMTNSYATTFDTEVNIEEWHLAEMIENTFKELGYEPEQIIEFGRWLISDRTVYSGNKWWDVLREELKDHIKKTSNRVTTPFPDRGGKSLLKIYPPKVVEIDSFSEFTTDSVEKMQDEAEVGESGQNAISLKQGQHKNQLLMDIIGLAGASNTYFLMTSHIGDEYMIDASKKATKKLADIPQGKKLKGVPEKFTYVMNNCWWATASVPLINQGTKLPEYPRDKGDDIRGDTDLKTVTLRQVRGKSGRTGISLDIIVSQTVGVLPSLTEFNLIKSNARFGFEGTNLVTYSLTLLPDVSITRNTIRGLLGSNSKLRRAVNITSELCQMQIYWFHLSHVHITPKDLYEKIKAAGYDWDMILTKTRGYWTLEEDERPNGLFLSTMDLIYMASGEYHPYWLEADKKTIKKKYLNRVPVTE